MTNKERRKLFNDGLTNSLNREMQNRGVSPQLLSVLTGFPLSTIYRYVSGKSSPNSYRIYKIAKALRCDIDVLVPLLPEED